MIKTAQRIHQALKAGREIEVIEQGGDRVMTAFEHPYVGSDKPHQATSFSATGSVQSLRDTRKARCYWYSGTNKHSAIFNLENLSPLY